MYHSLPRCGAGGGGGHCYPQLLHGGDTSHRLCVPSSTFPSPRLEYRQAHLAPRLGTTARPTRANLRVNREDRGGEVEGGICVCGGGSRLELKLSLRILYCHKSVKGDLCIYIGQIQISTMNLMYPKKGEHY